jgi:hypothetical protein
MKLIKVHCVMHAPDDISIFGLDKNWDTGHCESGHIDCCKKTAKLTQLQKDSPEDQTSHQTVNNMVMNEACSLIWVDKDYDIIDKSSNPVGGSTVLRLLSHLRPTLKCTTPIQASTWIMHEEKEK